MTTIDIWPTLLYEHHTQTWFHDKTGGVDEIQMINDLIKSNPDRLDGEDFYSLWKTYTLGIDNTNFPMYDLIVHDAAHDYDGVYADLVHWFPKLKSTGVMIIDDYDIQFSGLMQAVDRYVRENSLIIEMVTTRNILLKRA